MSSEKFSKEYLKQLKEKIEDLDNKKLNTIIQVILHAYKNDKQIFIFGNGGSASTSSHFANDLAKGTVKDFNDKNEKRFKVISLSDNIPLLTAYANDLSYNDIFSEQLANFVNEGDVVIGISASGNSMNVIKGIQLAKQKKAVTVGLCGFSGGELKEEVDYYIHVKSNHYGIVEDMHHVVMHIVSYHIKELNHS